MSKEKATIYDVVRMCSSLAGKGCEGCPLKSGVCHLNAYDFCRQIDEYNEKILKWCKEHPVKTRQDKFLEMFPNADVSLGYLDICPKKAMGTDWSSEPNCSYAVSQIRQIEICEECQKSYWLTEVEE